MGKHPEDGEPILANIGRYGPYVQHGKTYANLPDVSEVFEIGLNRAVTLIAEKRANPGRGRGAAVKPLRELGKHPADDEPVNVFSGRYGPYVKHGKTNATIPKEIAPEAITLEQAVALVDERAAKTGKGGKKKSAPKKKPASKTASAKKS